MVDGTSRNWFSAPRIYVENVRNGEAAYQISEKAILDSLSSVCSPVALTCRYSDDRDIDAFRSADVLVASRLETALIASEGKALKLIQCTSAGVEKYAPFSWLAESTMLTNASGVHADKVGDFGLMATLMLHERVPAIATRQRRHAWSRQLRGTAAGRRVMIYGVGALGGAIAQRLHSAGFIVTGVRRGGAPVAGVARMITPDNVHEELPKVEILILACPLTPDTQRVIGLRELSALPQGAGVLNVGRGGVMDHSALVSCLANGHLSGAILDVFDQEPLPGDSLLWDVPNLMVFPHVSADAPDGYIDRCLAILADNLERLSAGKGLRNIVDPMLGY
ncbi:D-2-hydroxyacid dehydrogenase [Ensifer sp. ENS02]|uniref:D-2-hydroxyacid dehydrogenase n=1 Tax=Ensifer sp. ENS02 TaxID=2769290 RepID=UPI00177F8978|nr:D-2-hydroxyacid dehydrogenase [Ensifer sp. ENS02]MBD9524699.1 D-2-hydroxyacid dehydrogenase [Ensifer sp. ENS02]